MLFNFILNYSSTFNNFYLVITLYYFVILITFKFLLSFYATFGILITLYFFYLIVLLNIFSKKNVNLPSQGEFLFFFEIKNYLTVQKVLKTQDLEYQFFRIV